jgi:hypothetical protein
MAIKKRLSLVTFCKCYPLAGASTISNMTTSIRHHFISQFYLAGFTNDGTKDGLLYCYDKVQKKKWQTTTSNIAYEKHFNTVDANGVEPDFIEKDLSSFETEASQAFKHLIQSQTIPSDSEFVSLMNFIALRGVRNPGIRTNFDRFRNQVFKTVISLYHQDEHTWESFRKRAMNDGVKILDDMSFEKAKKIFSTGDLKIRSNSDSFHQLEFNAIENVVQHLANRDWTVIANRGNEFFVTNDRPVILTWNNNSNISFGPGFASLQSTLIFPVSKSVALLGRFSDTPRSVSADRNLVAACNSFFVAFSTRFVYSPTEYFLLMDEQQNIVDSKILLGAT